MPALIDDKCLDKQELLTGEVQEVISYRPHWMVRRGNTIFLALIALLISLTAFIGYPDVIVSSARLLSQQPPKLITARTDGKLIKLFVSNDAKIEKGQALGYMESTADHSEILQLFSWVNATILICNGNNFDGLTGRPIPELANLGDIQHGYQLLRSQLEIVKQTFSNGYYARKKQILQKDIADLNLMKGYTGRQKGLQEKDRLLLQQKYNAYEKLAKENVIAPLELNQYKSELLGKDQVMEQFDAQITGGNISSQAKLKEMLDLDKQVMDHREEFRSILYQLKSEIEKWMQQYILSASENGVVLFTSTLTENQLIENGQPLFYIQPLTSAYYVEILAGQKGVGKVKKGQKVVLRVDGYPSEEFGFLEGQVDYISTMPNRTDSFLLKASLPIGLETNYHKNIEFRNNMTASAEIITDNRMLLDRLLGQLKKVMNR